MIYDGIVASYMYVYNGEKILIKDGYFAYIRYPDIDTRKYDLTADYYCDIVGDKLEIYGFLREARQCGNGEQTQQSDGQLVCVRRLRL